MFRPGDKVYCTSPIANLEYDKVYEVKEFFKANAPGVTANEFVTIKEFPEEQFMTFRFRLIEEFLPVSVVTESIDLANIYYGAGGAGGAPLNHVDKGTSLAVTENPPKTYINTVDEGLMTQSASKNDQDKLDLSLIPYIALKEEAKAFMVGEKKYGRYNYCKGHKASQLVSAMLRHISAWNEGEEHDPIDGQHHLGSVRACVAMILRQMELNTLRDDRYKK